jgi:hypothetical protein
MKAEQTVEGTACSPDERRSREIRDRSPRISARVRGRHAGYD